MKKMGYVLIYLSLFLVFSGLFLLKPIKYSYINLGNNRIDKFLNNPRRMITQVSEVEKEFAQDRLNTVSSKL